jgi:exonuclease III
MVAKQVAEANLLVCSLQEVRYRNDGKKVINLDSGESFTFYWSGPKKRRDGGVGVLIKQCKEISFDEPDILDPRIIAMNIKIKGYDIRLINAYAPTNCDVSENTKDLFYNKLRKSSIKQYKHQKLIVNGDFNATTEVSG